MKKLLLNPVLLITGCGLVLGLLTWITPAAGLQLEIDGTAFPLDTGTVTIGSSPAAGIRIPELEEQHARLTIVLNRPEIAPLDSETPVKINGRLITAPEALGPDDALHLGDMHARILYQESYPFFMFLAPYLILIVCFVILAKSADLFVDSAVGVAERFSVPKIIIGIFLVGLATTAPELAVSVMSALKGNPQFALGNAVGSVICDDGLALAAAAIFTTAVIPVLPAILKTAGLFLVGVDILAFLFIIRDNTYTLGRIEGAILLGLFFLYTVFIIRQQKKGRTVPFAGEVDEIAKETRTQSLYRLIGIFILGLGGILISSEMIIESAVAIATMLGIPGTVIAMTVIALGTSIPEIATCIIAARKGHGEIAVGNIIGADILNICWVAGASAIANPLIMQKKEILFMFPAMFVIVLAMLILMRIGHRLRKRDGIILFALYIIYLVLLVIVFPPNP